MSITLQQTPFNQKVTILNDSKYSLEGDPIEGSKPGRPPRLFFEVHGNYPRIRIRLNNCVQGEQGRLDLALDLIALTSIIEMIEAASKSANPVSYAMEVKKRGFDRQTNKPTEPYTQALIVIGRNTDGRVFFGVQRGNKNSKNYLKLNFHFLPPEFHPVIDLQTGQPLAASSVSTLIAKAWVRLLTNLVMLINANTWQYSETWEGKQAAKNGGNNGGQNNSGNGGYADYARGSNNNVGGNSGGYNSSSGNTGYSGASENTGYTPQPVNQPPSDLNFDNDIPF